MHGQGNDFIFLDLEECCFDETLVDVSEPTRSSFADVPLSISNIKKMSLNLCDRHFGIGGDGLILIEKMEQKGRSYSSKIRIYNSDGTAAETCGNALRCVAFYLYEKHKKADIDIHTISGIKHCFVDEQTAHVTVNMGKVVFKREATINVDNCLLDNMPSASVRGDCVDVGNPHFVIFDEHLADAPQEFWKKIETHKAFPDRTNVILILNNDFKKTSYDNQISEITIKIWERGSGFTLACGSGACAAAFVSKRLKKFSDTFRVCSPGGDVMVKVLNDDSCLLSGEVCKVFETELIIEGVNNG